MSKSCKINAFFHKDCGACHKARELLKDEKNITWTDCSKQKCNINGKPVEAYPTFKQGSKKLLGCPMDKDTFYKELNCVKVTKNK